MSDVARRSRISPATLYRKFAGKSGLVEAVTLREARRFVADMADTLEDVRRAGGDAEEQIVELALAVIDHLQRNKLLRRLLQTEPELVLPVLTTGGGPVLALGRDYLAGVLREFQDDGLMPEFDPVPMAEVLARLSLSFALTPDTALPLDDQEATRAIFRAHIVPALGLPAGPRPTTANRRSR
jgi:AcrR family transcriptional regulator